MGNYNVGAVTNIVSTYASKPNADSKNKPITVLGNRIPTGSADGTEIERTATPQVGPTIENAKKLEEERNASNPFIRKGSNAGSQVFNYLDKCDLIDWATGQIKTSFLSATMKSE